MQEKLHRPEERKRFVYSPSPFFPTPSSFHLCLPCSCRRYHAHMHTRVCVHAYDERVGHHPRDLERNVARVNECKRASEENSPLYTSHFKHPFGDTGIAGISDSSRYGRLSRAGNSSRELLHCGAPTKIGDRHDQRLPSRIGEGFRTGRIPRRVSRVAARPAATFPSKRTNDQASDRVITTFVEHSASSPCFPAINYRESGARGPACVP